jgi:hypothetical protein
MMCSFECSKCNIAISVESMNLGDLLIPKNPHGLYCTPKIDQRKEELFGGI